MPITTPERKRALTSHEIDDILDVVRPNPNLPTLVSQAIAVRQRDELRSQFVGELVYPSIIPVLQSHIQRVYCSSLAPPGQSVGIISAQSIGERQTQTSLNTFHKAGQSEKTMTEGIPRFGELINASRNPRRINHTIRFVDRPTSIDQLRVSMRRIANVVLGDIAQHVSYDIGVVHEPAWLDAYNRLYGDASREHSSYECSVTVVFDTHKLYTHRLTLEDIKRSINDVYADIGCICSPTELRTIYFTFDDNVILPLPNARLTREMELRAYLLGVGIPMLKAHRVCGIDGIDEIFISRTPGGDEWMCDTDSHLVSQTRTIPTFRQLLTLPVVCKTHSYSNWVWDIYNTFGIEAAREFLIREFTTIMPDINKCHIFVLVDRMTFGGTISALNRFTLRAEESMAIGKATFEETLDNLLRSSFECETDDANGVSASIVCGKHMNAGTGGCTISMDVDAFMTD